MSDKDRNELNISEEIIRLSIAAHCGEISETEADRLNTLLAQSESARQSFLLAAQDTHDLRDWATEYALRLTMEPEVSAGLGSCTNSSQLTRSAPQQSEPVRGGSSPLSFLPRAWQAAGFVAAAVAIAAVAGVLGWRLGQLTQQSIAVAPLESRPSIAQLTMANGCSWGGDSPQFTKLASQVRSGDEIVLHEGIAEFRLSSGVSFNVEGPSALVITSPTSLILQHGSTTVLIPANVKDFRLAAASCRLTASAAEFGVQVAGGKLDIHAFTGTVMATPTIQDDPPNELGDIGPGDKAPRVEGAAERFSGTEFTTTPIGAGQGVTLDCQTDSVTVSEWHPADESRFATRLSMAGPLPISKKYVDSVLKSKPLAYWRFENTKGNVVANEIGERAGLAIWGKVYLTKDTGNHAVELGRPGFDGAFYCKNELNIPPQSDYSVEAWIKPSHYHYGSVLNMIVTDEEGKTSAGFYLQTTAATSKHPETQRRVRFLHRDPPGSNSSTGTNCFSNVPYRLRRWQHVVAVKQGPEMRLYLDGNLVDTKRDPSSLAQHMVIIVGQLGQIAGLQRFMGQLDELAVYAHALKPEEIKSRFELVDSQTPAAKLRTEGI